MVLGTAQLGMDYGIARTTGKPSKNESQSILETAWNSGIRCFDTAPDYDSERILGEFIRSHGVENEITVLTKIPSLSGKSDWQTSIHKTINRSFNNLGCNTIKVLFLRSQDSLMLLEHRDFFEKLMTTYPISHLGASVYSPTEVERLSECELKLAFQYSYNILDRRFEQCGIATGLRFGRSVFLQGIISSTDGLRAGVPASIEKIYDTIHDFFKEKQIDPLADALRFVANSDAVDYFLVGVDTKTQLDQILSVDLSHFYPDDELKSFAAGIEEKWLDPRQWA